MMSLLSTDQSTAFIGIDWADSKHDICLQAADSQQRDKGRSHQTAVRALAFKWIGIFYRCWQSRTPYDESKYLNALKRHDSPLLKQIGAAT